MTVANINDAKRRKPARPPEDWRNALVYTEKGQIVGCVANVIQILANDEAWSGVVARNEFSAADASFRKAPPWDPEYAPRTAPKQGDPWSDADDARASAWLARHWSLNVAPGVVADAIKVVAAKHAYHPVRDYLGRLQHDGTPRLGTWLSTYLGAARSPYTEAVGRWWMISAVARIYQPGAKCDHLVIFEGKQGIGKSTALKVLASEEWFTDEISDLGNKDAAMQLQGRLIVELGELDALTRAEVSRVKAFLTRTHDKFRPPWGRRTIAVARQNVFAGTTNQTAYLKDETGARRFWPVSCERADIAALERDRDQLWAEAVADYLEGRPWWPTTSGEREQLAAEQEERRQRDPWEEPIAAWLAKPQLSPITTCGLLSSCIEKRRADWTRADEMRVAACLRALGYEQTDRVRDEQGRKIRAWTKASQECVDQPSENGPT